MTPASTMRFSIWASPSRPWDDTLELVRHCEATGWDGVYYADHLMPASPASAPYGGATMECWSVLAALAAAVPRLRVGSLVSSVTFRHPGLLAKIATAVDHISHGRLVLGIGAGWQENEHQAFGLEFGSPKERLDRFEEAIGVLASMLAGSHTTFAGQHFQLQDAPNLPQPVRSRIPLLIGGKGEKRTMRIAARHADEWNTWTTPEVLATKLDVLRRHCDEIGRDPAEIAVSTQALLYLSDDEAWLDENRRDDPDRPRLVGTPAEVADIVGRYRAAGAQELIIPDVTLGPLPQCKDVCDLFMEQVASAFR
jgi:F420-dependent oxidoreductase-like protein